MDMIEVDVKVKYDRCEKRLTVAFNKGITLLLGEVGSFKSTLLKVIGEDHRGRRGRP